MTSPTTTPRLTSRELELELTRLREELRWTKRGTVILLALVGGRTMAEALQILAG